ncbi:AraC family transcriptional regulator [Ammoniphilus sp. YIM 78166]|uniref:AraC family transcriptional regulator n=1 Tax=Ammoniphilus sp. YIM 78166 TaxID=1644106 RepID=UPI00142FE42F|nr:AraC family transcriptional regulator [Ammoniphilus sp. YIM 78166]
MQSITKIDYRSLFPFSFVFKDQKSPQRELPDHVHDYYELVFVYSGKGTFFIDDVFYDMNPGDVFILPNNTIHRAMPEGTDPVTSSVIFFSPTLLYDVTIDETFSYMSLFDNVKKQRNYQISIDSQHWPLIEAYLLTIQQEVTEPQKGSKHATLLAVHQILLQLSRIRQQDQAPVQPYHYGPSWIKEILSYIETHLAQELNLTDLAKEALVSPAHFSRVFKQTTGMGLTVYLNTKRMVKAKELLMGTDMTIAHIAEQTGYDSLTHFHRIFKKFVGTTPADFRKQSKIYPQWR